MENSVHLRGLSGFISLDMYLDKKRTMDLFRDYIDIVQRMRVHGGIGCKYL